jgi:hypothetical protein
MSVSVQRFQQRVLYPVVSVLLVAGISYFGYYGSRRIGIELLRQVLAAVSGTIYFLSIFFGPLFIFVTTYLRGASLRERVLASLAIPFLWMTKDVLLLMESHPFLECLYWYFNPLNIWMACLIAVQMGLGTMIAKYILGRDGDPVKVVTVGPVVLMLVGLLIFIGMYAWGQGENIFSLYLEGYRLLFGFGI